MLLLHYITYYNFAAEYHEVCVKVLFFDTVSVKKEEESSVRSLAEGDYDRFTSNAGAVECSVCNNGRYRILII